MPNSYWSAYTPDARVPWNLRRVVHLHQRAGFGATWGELQRDLKEGPKTSIDRFLAGKAYVEGVLPDFEATAALLGKPPRLRKTRAGSRPGGSFACCSVPIRLPSD